MLERFSTSPGPTRTAQSPRSHCCPHGHRESQSCSGGQTKPLIPWASSGTTSPTQLLLLLATFSATLSLVPDFIPSLEGAPGCLSLPQDRELWQLSPPQVQGQRHSTTSDLHTPAEGKQSPAPGVAGELQSCRKNISAQRSRDTRAWGQLSLARGWELLCSQAEGR